MHELIDMQNEPVTEDALLKPEQRAYMAGFKPRGRDIPEDKAVRWEALRSMVNTIGARDALAVALTQEGGAS